MTREEFMALPPSVALGLLWDTSTQLAGKLAEVVPPKPPRPPRFDSAIYRKDGVQWASETDLEGLRYWREKKLAVDPDPERAAKYGEKNAKDAKALEYWIAWRLTDPHSAWTGERNRAPMTAKAPSGKPTVYPRGPRGAPEPTRDAPDFDDASPGEGDSFDDSDIPF